MRGARGSIHEEQKKVKKEEREEELMKDHFFDEKEEQLSKTASQAEGIKRRTKPYRGPRQWSHQ